MNDSYLYTKDHEWINVDNDLAIIGITEFAQSELGDIIFVEFPQTGDKFKKGEVFGTIEAVKTVADLFMPVSGTIIEINTKIEDMPELINANALTDGWIVKIKLSDKDELLKLLSKEEYNNIING